MVWCKMNSRIYSQHACPSYRTPVEQPLGLLRRLLQTPALSLVVLAVAARVVVSSVVACFYQVLQCWQMLAGCGQVQQRQQLLQIPPRQQLMQVPRRQNLRLFASVTVAAGCAINEMVMVSARAM